MTIQKKLIEVAQALGKITKDSENPFEKWGYVSIDEYYDKVASAILLSGLSWYVEEKEFEFIWAAEAIVKASYLFTIYDGDKEPMMIGPLTVIHPYEGAQTTGKMVSYAEKIFMRQLLKVVTGEPDADATAPTKGKAPVQAVATKATAKKPEPRKVITDDLDDDLPLQILTDKPEDQYVQELVEKMEACKKREDLMKLWEVELPLIKGLTQEGYDYVRQEFRSNEGRLTNGSKSKA
jgi:hypothetical protein